MAMPGRKYSATGGYRYGFNGKEKSTEITNDDYDFGARIYDGRIGRWLSVDPLAGKFLWQSPYVSFDNNPINKIDPMGMAPSPIYDQEGNFLGTDDQGLKGNAIVMNKKDFTQGMSNKESLEKGSIFDYSNIEKDKKGKITETGKKQILINNKIMNHYEGLASRPDYEGIIPTREEGIAWAKAHPNALSRNDPNEMLYVDASSLDFGNINHMMFAKEGEITPVNLFNAGNVDPLGLNKRLESTVYALGRVNLIMRNFRNLSVEVVNDDATIYDWNRGGNPIRSKLIDRERQKFGLDDTHGFRIYYYGLGTLNN